MRRPRIYRRAWIPGPRARVGEIMPGLHQRALGTTSAFIVVTPDAATGEPSVAIIDAGWRHLHTRLVLGYLRRLRLGPESVNQLLATHWHPDHVGGMASLQRRTGAPVAAHWIEAPYLTGEAARPIPNPVEPRWARPLFWPLLSWLQSPAFPVARVLHEGDALPLMGGARVIHTPGHTPGSISLHFPNEGVLLVGDAVQRAGRRATLPARLFSSDMKAAKASVRKLAQLDFEIICFSHFQPMRQGARAALRSLAEYVS